jgi:hypothetical protein
MKSCPKARQMSPLANFGRITRALTALVLPLCFLAAPARADLTKVESIQEAFAVCSAYLLADLQYFEQNKGDADSDLGFEEALNSFVKAGHMSEWDSEPERVDYLQYKYDLVFLMLPIYLMMERQETDPTADAELQALQSFCAKIGQQNEETRWVFQ